MSMVATAQAHPRPDVRERPRPSRTATFPSTFWWGTATASFQVEGATTMDGRSPSIWDTFTDEGGHVVNQATGRTGADHYRRAASDVALLQDLGVTAYRFSVSWPRIQPDATTPAHRPGLDFYDRLLDELLAAGIAPMLAVYHWDLPQWVENLGGWTHRDTARRLGDLAATLGAAFGDRVSMWTTMIDPWSAAFLGYGSGEHAPGRTGAAGALTAAHHLQLGHGWAVQALRSTVPAESPIAISLNVEVPRPASSHRCDVDAARRVDALRNRVFLDPLLLGTYPEDLLDDTAAVTEWGFVHADDLDVIATPIDVLGVGYYGSSVVQAVRPSPDHDHGRSRPVNAAHQATAWPGSTDIEFVDPGCGRTDMGWPIDPNGLLDALTRIRRDYRSIPVVVETGASFADRADAAGAVADQGRADYLERHLGATRAALAAGVDVRGYFVWSLFDGFDWAWGYDRGFGVVRVEPGTGQRVWKQSAHWLRQAVADARGATHNVVRASGVRSVPSASLSHRRDE